MAAAVPTMPISPMPLTPSGLTLVLVLVDEDHVDIVDVGVHRHVVLGEIVVHEAAELVVEHASPPERHADAPDHAAHDLAARGLGIEDAAGRRPR